MNRTKLFVDNFFSYGIISVINKLIPFLLLPIITRLLPATAHFGVFDIYQVLVYFGTSIAFLGLFNATYREYFDTEDMQLRYDVTRTTFGIMLISSLCVSLIFVVFRSFFTDIFIGDRDYTSIIVFVAITVFTTTMMELFRIPSRMQNHKKVFLNVAIISTLTEKVIAIILILLNFVYLGLIWGMIISNVAVTAYLWFRNSEFFLRGRFDKKLAMKLLRLGLPLLPVGIIFWVFHSISRVMILRELNFTELGIYSIGIRVAMISQFIYYAFSTGWAYFAFSTIKDRDYKELMSKTFTLMFVGCTSFYVIVFLFKDIIFDLLFIGDYVRGVDVFPFLLLNPLLLILIVILDHQLIVTRKTLLNPVFYLLGCAVNILLNIYLIPAYGIVGAAISTVCGYLVCMLTFLVYVCLVKRLIKLRFRDIFIMLGFFLMFVSINWLGVCIYSLCLVLFYISIVGLLYYQQIKKYTSRLLEKNS
jgi:O-antigen/teichoic acid export membrane protein